MESRKGKKDVIITGTVVPTDWGTDGKVVAVALSTPSEDEYTITNDTLGQELLHLVGAKVVATGTVTDDKNWNRCITLDGYETLEDDEDDENDFLDDEEEYLDNEEFDDERLFEADEEW